LQHFALDRISYTEATSYLNEHLAETASVPPELLLGLSNDMPLQAVEIATSDWFAKRQSFLEDWTKVVNQKNMPLFYSAKWQKELNFSDF
ncbi:DNA polymerase III subunit delta', partial [Acinetobacter baumannii]